MAKMRIEELDKGQLDLMWNFLKMGNGTPNIKALKEHLDMLRQMMIQKTAGQTAYKKSYEISLEAGIDELYGDSKDDDWKAEEAKRIKEEMGIAVAEETSEADDI